MSSRVAVPDFVDELVEVTRSVSLDALPESVVAEARRLLVDTFACILAGMSAAPAKALAAEMVAASAAQCSTILGCGSRADAMWAALANGTAGVWHDLDPGHRFAGGHPAIHVIPAALAVAEREGASGRRFLEAVIGGYEIAARIGLGTKLREGMHPHGTWPNVGAAAAAAQLLRLSQPEVREAINISTSLTLATSFQAALEGATVRNVYAGFGAAMGVFSADLTVAGFTGERQGIATVFGTISGERFDDGQAREGLGRRWEILRGYTKMHASARYLHTALDVLIDLVEEDSINPDQVDSIEVNTFAVAAGMTDPRPANPLAAKFSLPFAMAAYLVLHDTGIDAFEAEALSNPDILALAARIRIQENQSMTARYPAERTAEVVVHLRGGRSSRRMQTVPRGEFDYGPYSDEQLGDRFCALASRSLGSQAAATLLARLWDIEQAADIREITALAG